MSVTPGSMFYGGVPTRSRPKDYSGLKNFPSAVSNFIEEGQIISPEGSICLPFVPQKGSAKGKSILTWLIEKMKGGPLAWIFNDRTDKFGEQPMVPEFGKEPAGSPPGGKVDNNI